ncbi:MAG: hypothetical protein H0V29_07100 [Thermoleophilaceae bacterium]|nr:hypothetical protein [Thermoleophilaceae bacterium]
MAAHRRDIGLAAAAMAIAGVAALWALGLKDADLSTPFNYTGDAHQVRMSVKVIVEHLWPFREAALGAPGTALHYDFPLFAGDWLQIVPIWLLGRVNDDPVWVTNVWELLTFPLVALAAFGVLRALGVSGLVAMVIAVLYSLLPYHFGRGQVGLPLSLYVAGPLTVLLFMRALEGRALWGRWRRTLGTLAICLVIGATGVFYYGTFAVILLVAVAGIAGLMHGRRAAFATAFAAVAVAGTMALGYLPTAIHQLREGSNPVVPGRTAGESESGGLKLAQLVLPVRGHRFGRARRLSERYFTTGTPQPAGEAQYSALGLAGAIGLAWLLLVALAGVAGGRRLPDAGSRESHASAGALITLLVGTIGGVSALVAYLALPTLRSWNRISVLLAFFALLALALLLDRGRDWLKGRGAPAVVAPLVLALVLLAGIYDQTSESFKAPLDVYAAQYRADQDLVAAAEATLPAGAAVLQIPPAQYPEASTGDQDFYDPLRPYVISDKLRWSYGQMKGRPQDWLSTVALLPPSSVLKAGAAAGFQGVWFDAAGAPGPGAEGWRAVLRATLRTEPVRSPDGRFEFWDMRPYARRLGAAELTAARDSAIHPLRRELAEGFAPERTEGGVQAYGFGPLAAIAVINPAREPRAAVLSGFVRSSGPVQIAGPGNPGSRIPPSSAGRAVAEHFVFPPGASTVQVGGPAGGDLLQPTLVDERLEARQP